MKLNFYIGILLLILTASVANATPPKLVLQITVDGLRADLLNRYSDNFGKGGFSRLMREGAVFTNAHYLHANTETIVGHTTLATGATPAVHGMVGNVWYHADSGELGYNIEDPEAPLLPTRDNAMQAAQVDPAQKRARSNGRSPRAILAPTLADTLLMSRPGEARVFGPSSLENEDIVLQLDSTLADLLSYVDKTVGLEDTLIVLSADHGMAEMPEYATERGYPAQRLFSHQVLKEARAFAGEKYGDESLIREFFRPYLYLDAERLAKKALSRDEVTLALANALIRREGIRAAVPSSEASALGEMAVAHNHHRKRSGDLYIYPEPYWFLFDKGPIGVMHGSPWAYDQHVPMIFAGPGVAQGRYNRRVHPIDVAPTLAALLGISAPAAAEGSALEEALR